MARYIKANPKVVQYLHLENDRNKVKDGNYLLWQADILPFGRLTELPQILEQIGGIALLAHEARQEQDGTVCRELPTATDSRFVVEKIEDAGDGEEPSAPAESEGGEDKAETEQPAEGPELEPGENPEETESKTDNTETV